MATGDVGAPINLPTYTDGSVQIEGTIGGATTTIKGTNEATPTNWEIITDPQGNDIVKTTADLEQMTEIAYWLRPEVTGGAGAAITVTMTLRRTP